MILTHQNNLKIKKIINFKNHSKQTERNVTSFTLSPIENIIPSEFSSSLWSMRSHFKPESSSSSFLQEKADRNLFGLFLKIYIQDCPTTMPWINLKAE